MVQANIVELKRTTLDHFYQLTDQGHGPATRWVDQAVLGHFLSKPDPSDMI